MKPVDAEEYFDLVMKGFAGVDTFENDEMTILTESIFKLQWMTRVHFNSFITFTDEIDAQTLNLYMIRCFNLTKKRQGMLGEPAVCAGVVISENVARDARDYALKRPKLHTSINEYPVVVDLKSGEAYYYAGPVLYRILYEKFEREYINGHFALPLQILKEKQPGF